MLSLNDFLTHANSSKLQEERIQMDRLTFYPGQLVVVGSRPGMGRTTFLLSILNDLIAREEDGFLFLSNEADEKSQIEKLLCQFTDTPHSEIDFSSVVNNHPALTSKNILFHYDKDSWENQKETITSIIKMHNIRYLFIDKLQGIYSEKGFKTFKKHWDYIIKDLKQLAVDYNLVVFVTSNLKRTVARREGKYPVLSDFRGTATIEETCDQALLLHRPEYYGITEDINENSLVGIAEVIVAKNRIGETGTLIYKFDKSIPKFSPFDINLWQ